MPNKYFQVGGFQGQVRELTNDLLLPPRRQEKDCIILVLGILPNGASYLLLPYTRYVALYKNPPRIAPFPAKRFLSLSPIYFLNRDEMNKKLSTLASNKKTRNEKPRDRSKANTSFTAAGDGLSEIGKARASFEHQRVICRAYQNELDIDMMDTELSLDSTWMGDTRVLAFTFNTWKADSRPLHEREVDPKLLDVGWTEFSFPDSSGEEKFVTNSSTHITVSENQIFGNPGMKRLSFEFGETESHDLPTIHDRFQQLLSTPNSLYGPKTSRTMLLVHDEQKTVKVLQAMGINTSHWTSGIYTLLYGEVTSDSAQSHNVREDQQGGRSLTSRDPRRRSSRSRSPRRRKDGAHGAKARSPPPPPPIKQIVYVVDVRSLYLALRQVAPLNDTVSSNALDLGVALEIEVTEQGAGVPRVIQPSRDGWCAGNESRFLGAMWCSMACGSSIDEQRALRWSSSLAAAASSGPAEQAPTSEPERDSDEDVDPNDMVQPAGSTSTTSSYPVVGAVRGNISIMDPDGWDEESDEDY